MDTGRNISLTSINGGKDDDDDEKTIKKIKWCKCR